jgi:hypothetical protein
MRRSTGSGGRPFGSFVVMVLVGMLVAGQPGGAVTAAADGLPDLYVESAMAFEREVVPGGRLTVSVFVSNAVAEAGPSVVGVYLTDDFMAWADVLEPGDPSGWRLLQGDIDLPRLAAGGREARGLVKVPHDVLPGEYLLIACADHLDEVAESDETNNCGADSRTTTVLDRRLPDLSVHGVMAEEREVVPGGRLTVTAAVINHGTVTAGPSRTGFFLGPHALSGELRVPEIAAGGSFTGSTVVTVPHDTPPGSYRLGACADSRGQVEESDETWEDNCRRDISTTRVLATACAGRAVPRAPFTDHRPSVHADAVDCAVWWGIARGRTATSYAPKAAVTRAQMASFVARLIEAGGGMLPHPSPQGFTDLAGAGPHADRIDQLAAVGVVRGRTATSYAPQAEVSRAQMATFLVNAYEYVAERRLPRGSSGFADIAGNTHEVAIDKSFTAGFARGRSATVYAPNELVVREQMASFLTRVLDRFAADGNNLRRL